MTGTYSPKLNDDIIYIILNYNFPRSDMVTLLKNEHYKQKYTQYMANFNGALIQQVFYSNCKDMYYLFLFERNNTTIEDINSVFLALDERGVFTAPYYFSKDTIMDKISDLGDDLWNFYFFQTDYARFWEKQVQKKRNKLNFTLNGQILDKKTHRNLYALDIVSD